MRLEELNKQQQKLLENQQNEIKNLNKNKEIPSEKNRLSGCKLSEVLKFLRKHEKLEDIVKNSANSNSDGHIYARTKDGRALGSTVQSYIYSPVCQNQTRYMITTDALGNILEIDRKIER